MLQGARRPVIILGGGAQGAGDAAVRIAETLGAPLCLTTAGKGATPESHPLCRGYCLAQPDAQRMLRDADMILAAGTELSETDFWTSGFQVGPPLIRIDLDPGNLARPHPAALAMLADAGPALRAIAAGLSGPAAWPPEPARVEEDALRQMLRRALDTIRAALPEDAIVTSDMTQIAYAANEVFGMEHPRTWIHPVGFGTLGFGLPAGIGAKIARPDAPVAVLAGDYGFQYTANELGTAAEHRLPIVILLWNNDALGQIRDDMVRKGIQPNAVGLFNPDFQLLAKAYGIAAERPASLAALDATIRTALKADGPTLIEMTPRMAGLR